MSWYCIKCKCLHTETELCPRLREQLIQYPELLGEAADFTAMVGQYHLITSNTLDSIAKNVNKLTGSNLTYEGTHQLARDIQVFNRLNTEAFCRAGVFSSPEVARAYLENATPGQLKGLIAKVNGSAQEVDWLREMQSRLSSVIRKNELLNGNAPGVDGVTYSRFTGKIISRTTVKASQSYSGINTNVKQVVKAIKSDRLEPNEIVYGVKGTETGLFRKLDKEIQNALNNNDLALVEKLRQAKDGLKVIENNTPEQIAQNNKRLMDKIAAGKATTHIGAQEVASQALNGAIIGAAVNLSIASITNYLRLLNGEITLDEVIADTSESTIKGVVTGASLSAVTLFLPAGPLGFVAGIAVGIYVDTVCGNVLEEIYGKGAYGAILDAAGYTYGMTVNLQVTIEKISTNSKKTNSNIRQAKQDLREIESGFDEFERLKGE